MRVGARARARALAGAGAGAGGRVLVSKTHRVAASVCTLPPPARASWGRFPRGGSTPLG